MVADRIFIYPSSFFGLFAGSYYANKYISENLRPVSISKIGTKQLQYVDALMVDFNITNDSNDVLNVCKIELDFYLGSTQTTKDFLSSLNPFAKKRIILNEELLPKQSIEIKEFVNDFAFIDYNITKKAECFLMSSNYFTIIHIIVLFAIALLSIFIYCTIA